MEEIITQIFQVGFFTAIIRIATPFVFATIGELFAERSGVLNLGIEGIMMFGAMTGFSTAYFTSSLWLGIMAAMLTGMLMAALMGFLTVSLGLSQHVSGIGITMLSTGFAFFSTGSFSASRQLFQISKHLHRLAFLCSRIFHG